MVIKSLCPTTGKIDSRKTVGRNASGLLFFSVLFGVLVKRILTNMLKLWYNRQNTKEKFLDFGAIVGE